MKILFYLHQYPNIGGIEKVTEIVADYLSEKGHQISILSYIRNPTIKVNNPNITYYVMPEQTFVSRKNTEYIYSLFVKENFDITIFQDSYAPIETPLFSAIQTYPTKLIIVEHNTPNCGWKIFWYNVLHFSLPIKNFILLPYSDWYMSHFTKKRHKYLYENADRYILLSQRFIPILSNIIKIKNPSKCHIINNPITIKTENNYNLNKKKQLLFVGRFTYQKGINLLLKIWKSIYSQYPDWSLILVGGGKLEKYIKSYIAQYNLENIRIEGFQENTGPYYAESRILCMTSIFEGWGLVLTEAMSLGCVPIAFDSFEAVYDIIDDSKNGFIIPHFNLKYYINKLQLIMENEDLYNNLSKNAIIKSKRFTIDNIGKQWERLIQEIK